MEKLNPFRLDSEDIHYYKQGELGEGESIPFNIRLLPEALKQGLSESVAVVVGGTRLMARKVLVKDGVLIQEKLKVRDINLESGDKQTDYAEALEVIRGLDLPVFLTVAGPVVGTTWHPTNLPELGDWYKSTYTDTDEEFSGIDFSVLFGENLRIVVNDAPAALASSIYHLLAQNPELAGHHFILEIIGTGNGLCFFLNNGDGTGIIVPTEIGHIGDLEWLDMFNTGKETSLSGGNPAMETVVAGRGIVAIWEAMGGERGLSAKDIAERIGKDLRAHMAFQISAAGASIQILRVIETYEMERTRTTVVLRGGVTQAPFYPETVKSHLEDTQVYQAASLTESNADIEGAVLMYLAQEAMNTI